MFFTFSRPDPVGAPAHLAAECYHSICPCLRPFSKFCVRYLGAPTETDKQVVAALEHSALLLDLSLDLALVLEILNRIQIVGLAVQLAEALLVDFAHLYILPLLLSLPHFQIISDARQRILMLAGFLVALALTPHLFLKNAGGILHAITQK